MEVNRRQKKKESIVCKRHASIDPAVSCYFFATHPCYSLTIYTLYTHFSLEFSSTEVDHISFSRQK